MSNFQPSFKENPLNGYMRQPKLYIRLPSEGKYWAKGSIENTETGEYPVYSMTAKDELMLKVPDAVISGQAVVNVIQHCIPNIKNAWSIPILDLDAVLIAIRMATYGDKMKLTIPATDTINDYEYEVDLRYVLGGLLEQIQWTDIVQITPELILYVKPFDYKQLSASATKTFETQKLLQNVNSSTLTEEEKNKIFKESIDKLNEITIGLINNSIYKIDTPNHSIVELHFIKEFMENVDSEVFNKVKMHVESMRERNTVKPIVITPTDDMILKGFSNDSITIPLSFDPSHFFA